MKMPFTFQKIQAGLQAILRQGFCESCCLCDRSSDTAICQDCWRQVLACQQFGPLPSTASTLPMLVWGRYQDELKRAIAQMKYSNKPAIASRLGQELGLRWLQTFPKIKSFQVIPIPLHRDRLIERGYNQAELIARKFCHVVGVPCLKAGLIRIHQTQAQYTLDPSHRMRNLQGAFSIGPGLRCRSKPILLLDDIFTTGATTVEATRTLKQAKVTVLGTAVVAQAIFDKR